jgi:lipopolysaccharide biosynthesis glycosyltransferase
LYKSEIPKPEKNSITVVSVSDDNYVPHLASLIESIKDSLTTHSPGFFLELFILDGGISASNKKLLIKQFHLNFSGGNINFLNCANLYSGVDAHTVFTNATFYRLSLGRLLPNHSKVLYIDSDTIVLGNILDIWSIDLGDKVVAAAPDIIMKSFVKSNTVSLKEAGGLPAKTYLSKKLNMNGFEDDYFQAGVMLFDLNKMRKINLEDNSVKDLTSSIYWFLDQDVLNKNLVGKVKFIDTAWNCVNVGLEVSHNLSDEWVAKIKEDLRSPSLVHYAGYQAKPWNNRSALWSDVYWFYLRKTFWYEFIIHGSGVISKHEVVKNRGLIYKILRKFWRKFPNIIRIKFSPLAHWIVAKTD